MTFANRPGDAIRGLPDNGGSPVEYCDGNGVEAQIWRGGSEDLTLRLYYRNTDRRFDVATGTQKGWFLNVARIGADVDPGETKVRNAAVQTYIDGSISKQGLFEWCGDSGLKRPACDGDPGSGVVSVTRIDANTWTISNDDDHAAYYARRQRTARLSTRVRCLFCRFN